MRFDAHTRVHRETAVLAGQHLFGICLSDQAPAHEGARDASTQIGLHLGHSGLVDSTRRVEGDARWCGWRGGIGIARHFLKHPFDHTDVKVGT